MSDVKRSFVLLKNDNNIIPLKKDYKKIAVIGPLAKSKDHPTVGWEAMGNPTDVVSIFEGLKKYLGNNTELLYSEGCDINNLSTSGFDDAVETASNSELVILCLGEGKNMSGEACSRSTLDLLGVQEELAKEIYKTGKPIIVVLMNGRPLSINWLSENVPAILETWFPGITAGDAIAKVLFGEYNPSGKLPVTFPRTVGQVPIYYNHKNTGRPGDLNNHFTSKYLDLPLTPLYPFGYGLSYTSFEYSGLNLSSKEINDNDKLTITLKLKNTGMLKVSEVVQLYIKDIQSSLDRPLKELKGFKKVSLNLGEEKTIELTIDKDALSFFDPKTKKWVAESGEFEVLIGSSSKDIKLRDSFTLE